MVGGEECHEKLQAVRGPCLSSETHKRPGDSGCLLTLVNSTASETWQPSTLLCLHVFNIHREAHCFLPLNSCVGVTFHMITF